MNVDEEWFDGRLRDLRKTREDVGAALRLSRSQASRILSGEQRMRLDEVPVLAAVLEVSELEILYRAGLWNGTRPPIVTAPLLSSVEAGNFAETPPEQPPRRDRSILVEYFRPTVFALEVKGDSMNKVAPEDSIVVVDYMARDVNDGDLCVVRRYGEATFKRYREDAHGKRLEPDSTNPRHTPIFATEDEPIEIIGQVVDIRPEYRGKSAA